MRGLPNGDDAGDCCPPCVDGRTAGGVLGWPFAAALGFAARDLAGFGLGLGLLGRLPDTVCGRAAGDGEPAGDLELAPIDADVAMSFGRAAANKTG